MLRIPAFAPVLLASAALAATAPPARAQSTGSSVTVYGLVDAVVRHASNVSSTGKSIKSMEDGLLTGSRLGFTGKEALGDGWSAGFTMESGFDPGTGTSSQGTATADYGQEAGGRMWGRQLFVTLKTPWAGVSLGRQYTTAHLIAARFQPQGNPNNTALSVFSSHHVARQDNVLRIDGKVLGLDVEATRTFGEQPGAEANGAYALGAGYSGSNFYVGGYAQQLDNRAGTETRKILGLGGNWRVVAPLTLHAGVMRRSAEISPQRNRVWAIGAKWQLSSPFSLSAQFFDDRQTGSAALEGARKVLWLMADYEFSKRTDVYAVFDRNRVSGGYAKPTFMGTMGEQKAFSVALRHRF
jgi:predicted porin